MFVVLNTCCIKEFPSLLLFIFMGNFFLYFFFYGVMKLVAGERPTISCWVFLFLTVVLALPAATFFRHKVLHHHQFLPNCQNNQ